MDPPNRAAWPVSRIKPGRDREARDGSILIQVNGFGSRHHGVAGDEVKLRAETIEIAQKTMKARRSFS